MTIAVGGHRSGEDEDPFWVVPSSPLDAPVAQGSLTKAHREDLQMLGFANVVSLTISAAHPIGLSVGEDPPDRVVHVEGRSYGFELTELTMFDVRQDLAHARRLGRTFEEHLHVEVERVPHLVGRRVVISALPDEPLPRDFSALIDELTSVLREDKGCVGDGVDLSGDLPDPWPNDRGFYGRHGPVVVTVYSDGRPGTMTVASACQAEVRLSEAVSTLRQRVDAKDRPPNEVLLISCGVPDGRGHVCTADPWMYRLIAENIGRLHLAPKQLKAILLHLWGTLDWAELYRADGADNVWPSLLR